MTILQHVGKLLHQPESSDPVVLVHGVFGSGKSTLLVALVMFLTRVFETSSQETCNENRVLITAATNVAVDNILMGLVKRDFHDFVRVLSIHILSTTRF